MLLALIGDIHGNLPALEAVLERIDDEGIQTVLNTGDAVGGFPWPNEVVDLLRRRDIPSVQGEVDRMAAGFLRRGKSIRGKASPEMLAHLEWTYDRLRSDNLEHLGTLPRHRALCYEGIDVFLCHGSPSSQSDSLLEDDEEARFLRQRETANAPVVVCGRTHRPFWRDVAGTHFIDPGSVGIPAEGRAVARYAVLDTEQDPWSVDLAAAPYDLDAALRRLDDLGLPRPC